MSALAISNQPRIGSVTSVSSTTQKLRVSKTASSRKSSGRHKLIVMKSLSTVTPKLFLSSRIFAAIGLGVGAEFLAECLKFIAGAGLRTIQELILLYSFDPMREVWSFVKEMLLIGLIVGVLIYASVRVGKAISKILHHRARRLLSSSRS